VGKVGLEDLWRLKPVGRAWGGDRGLPIDRYYIEDFLKKSEPYIRGRVLEIGDNDYTRRYGGNRVTKSEILHASKAPPKATYVADLVDAPHVPSGIFDCIILTQTLQLIDDLPLAVKTLHRILKPGGTLLATVPGISQIYKGDQEDWKDYWRLTTHSAEWLFRKFFSANEIEIKSCGNILAAIAFLQGLAVEDVNIADLEHCDSYYQLLILIKATKSLIED
jgi:SAM-dependent methyltransferase